MSFPPGYFLKVCVGGKGSPLLFPLTLLSAAFQPISLLSNYDGSSQTFGSRLILDGWQWSDLGIGFPSRLPFPASI
ncbi:hypothetical protein B9T07_16430 [Limnospira fusiformis CCALA 023]|nr:MAG: hypothetical protein EA414_07785 [Arthrospira sp. PLM2.Bin9]